MEQKQQSRQLVNNDSRVKLVSPHSVTSDDDADNIDEVQDGDICYWKCGQ